MKADIQKVQGIPDPSIPYRCRSCRMHPSGSRACSHSGRIQGGCGTAGPHHSGAHLFHTHSHLWDRQARHPEVWTAPLQGLLGRELDGEAVWIQGGSNLTHTLRAILIGMVTTPADQWVPLTCVGTHRIDAAESRAAGLQQRCAFVDVCKKGQGAGEPVSPPPMLV